MTIFEIVVLGAVLLCLAYMVFRSLRSPLRPYLIPLEGWRVALALVRATPKPIALALLVIALGDGMQEFFTYGPKFNTTVLTLASVGWQLVMATLLAGIAVPLHLSMIDREPRGLVVMDPVGPQTTFAALLLRAALLGAAIWFVDYLLNVGGKVLAISVPHGWDVFAYRAVQLLEFVAGSLMWLIRPSLSSGLYRPVLSGLRLAADHFSSVILVRLLLLLPSLAFNVIGIELVRAYFGLSLGVHMLNDASIIVFSALNYVAAEASTVVLTRAAILRPDPDYVAFGRQDAYAQPS